MTRDIVLYGHPILRTPGKKIENITEEIHVLARDMIDTMRSAHGVGLAAQQIGVALQICVIEIPPEEVSASEMLLDGKPVNPSDHMPLVLINPQLSYSKEKLTAQEGCLSFPDIRAPVTRAAEVEVSAQTLHGAIRFTARGLLSRVIQHEVDHLNGVLFIDRMSASQKFKIAKAIRQIQHQTQRQLKLALKTQAQNDGSGSKDFASASR